MQDEADNTAADLEREVHALRRAGKLKDAVALCKKLNHEFPNFLSGWYTASRLAMQVNEPEIALRAIDQALAFSPGRPELLLQRLACLGVTEKVGEARELGSRIGTYAFPNAALSSNAGEALSRIGLQELANYQFERAAELEPGVATNHYNLASTLSMLGRLDEAEQRLDRALEIDPGDSQAHILRSGLRTQSADSNHISELSDAILHASTDPDRVHLGFALAKEWEDLGEFDNAFNALTGAATLRRKSMQYEPQLELDLMQRIRQVFDANVLERGGGHVNAAPIFVVGMPCSGTSVIDEVLAVHPVVTSAGEIRSFPVELQNLCQQAFDTLPPTPAELVEMAAKIDFETLGEAYIDSTQSVAGGTAHFVDRLSLNFLYCGLIHLALPKARIVLMRRDPMDTCFALYRTLFEGGYSYSYDLEELGNYFVEFYRLTQHWLGILGDRIHVVHYDELISDQRSAVEKLLDYCGLTHDAACFTVQASAASGSSASISLTSPAGTWRNYETQLQPVYDLFLREGIVAAE